jgi:NAD(P)-dependent dehydrogenase (short-subunit alcohol dehydrogenase family)
VKSLIFGASGGLADAIAQALLARDWQVDLVTRKKKRDELEHRFRDAVSQNRVRVFAVEQRYSSFIPQLPCNAYFFTQALFSPKPIVLMDDDEIAEEIEVGLVDVIQLVRKLLSQHPPDTGERRDFCFIGSTSAYAGFRNTSVYCAVKHGLLGFVRALNDEYAQTNTRFWLFSMGTMDTEMGRRLTEQDQSSFLQPGGVAGRIVEAICSQSNIFEPEVILRRRTIGFLEK